jgi:hypothetical protein
MMKFFFTYQKFNKIVCFFFVAGKNSGQLYLRLLITQAHRRRRPFEQHGNSVISNIEALSDLLKLTINNLDSS